GVNERDALDGGILAGVEECLRPRVQGLEGVARRGGRRRGDLLDESALDVLVHGLEELQLAGEVVVQGPPRYSRGADDLLRGHGRVAACGEQLARRLDQRCPRRLGLVGLARSRRPLPLRPRGILRFDIHTVCMIDTYCLYVSDSVHGDIVSTITASETPNAVSPTAAESWLAGFTDGWRPPQGPGAFG